VNPYSDQQTGSAQTGMLRALATALEQGPELPRESAQRTAPRSGRQTGKAPGSALHHPKSPPARQSRPRRGEPPVTSRESQSTRPPPLHPIQELRNPLSVRPEPMESCWTALRLAQVPGRLPLKRSPPLQAKATRPRSGSVTQTCRRASAPEIPPASAKRTGQVRAHPRESTPPPQDPTAPRSEDRGPSSRTRLPPQTQNPQQATRRVHPAAGRSRSPDPLEAADPEAAPPESQGHHQAPPPTAQDRGTSRCSAR